MQLVITNKRDQLNIFACIEDYAQFACMLCLHYLINCNIVKIVASQRVVVYTNYYFDVEGFQSISILLNIEI